MKDRIYRDKPPMEIGEAMVEYDKLKIGDKLQIIGAGAPGFAKLGDVVTVEKTGANRCDVVHDGTGERAYFALTCGAARLERHDASSAEPPVAASERQADACR